MGGPLAGDAGPRVTVVVEEIEPPELFEWFVRLRTDLGMKVVPLGPAAAAVIVKALNENQIVCLLSDRDIAGGGIEVEFFGERTTLPAGPATLALRRARRSCPSACTSPGACTGISRSCRPPLDTTRKGKLREDVARVTQDLAHELEYLIRRAPEQWHLFQPNWPSDPGYVQNPRVDSRELGGRDRLFPPSWSRSSATNLTSADRWLIDVVTAKIAEAAGSAGIGRRRRRAVAIVAASRPDAYRGTRRRLSCPGVHKSRSAHACVLIWELVGCSRWR